MFDVGAAFIEGELSGPGLLRVAIVTPERVQLALDGRWAVVSFDPPAIGNLR
jgi:hypothetical protein